MRFNVSYAVCHQSQYFIGSDEVAWHHAITHPFDEGGHDDDEGDYDDHDDEGDHSSRTLSHQSLDDAKMLELEDVQYLSPNKVD